ncbi:hypothetical protein LCGC14_0195380 [marine sediment metagenome]|uniref:Uncharacterized protein n=1 Tax=marine sediment metagenome TaxID=412755 RepID=A0A0F9UKB8_9ZZZZ
MNKLLQNIILIILLTYSGNVLFNIYEYEPVMRDEYIHEVDDSTIVLTELTNCQRSLGLIPHKNSLSYNDTHIGHLYTVDVSIESDCWYVLTPEEVAARGYSSGKWYNINTVRSIPISEVYSTEGQKGTVTYANWGYFTDIPENASDEEIVNILIDYSINIWFTSETKEIVDDYRNGLQRTAWWVRMVLYSIIVLLATLHLLINIRYSTYD